MGFLEVVFTDNLIIGAISPEWRTHEMTAVETLGE